MVAAYCKTTQVQDAGATYACAFAGTVEEACSGGTPGRVDKRDIQTTDPQAAQCPDGSWVTRFELK